MKEHLFTERHTFRLIVSYGGRNTMLKVAVKNPQFQT